MRVFVLTTGRCGSTTFSKACSHIDNYTSAHQGVLPLSGRIDTKVLPGLDYPDNHIEVDPHLAWRLGRLHFQYPAAFYVHLTRKKSDVHRSFLRKWIRKPQGQVAGWWEIHGRPRSADRMYDDRAAAIMINDMLVETNMNIVAFLRDKRRAMEFQIENYEQLWPVFLREIGAQTSAHLGMFEFENRYGAFQPAPKDTGA